MTTGADAILGTTLPGGIPAATSSVWPFKLSLKTHLTHGRHRADSCTDAPEYRPWNDRDVNEELGSATKTHAESLVWLGKAILLWPIALLVAPRLQWITSSLLYWIAMHSGGTRNT